jgi:hypothetical protein
MVKHQELCDKLGYLFYAVAKTDGEAQKELIAELRKAIELCWLSCDGSADEPGIQDRQFIFSSFDYLYANNVSAAAAYAVFQAYYAECKHALTKALRHRILSTAYSVSNVFKDQHRKESGYLEKIEHLIRLESQTAENQGKNFAWLL